MEIEQSYNINLQYLEHYVYMFVYIFCDWMPATAAIGAYVRVLSVVFIKSKYSRSGIEMESCLPMVLSRTTRAHRAI